MSVSKISVMLIAPYQAMADSVTEICRDYPDIELEPFIGNMEAGIRYCREATLLRHYDLILSRGGTTTVLRQTAEIPVIDIEVSAYDMLRSILAAQQYGREFAVVGFSTITEQAHQLCETVGWDLSIHEVRSGEDAASIVSELYARDPQMLVVGDVISSHVAEALGMNNILITSGQESIRKALDDALNLCRNVTVDRGKAQFFRIVLDNAADPVAVFDEGRRLLYTNLSRTESRYLPLLDQLGELIPQLRQQGSLLTNLICEPLSVSVRGLCAGTAPRYYVFWLTPVERSLANLADAISIYNDDEERPKPLSLADSSEYMLPLVSQLRELFPAAQLPPGARLALRVPSVSVGLSAAGYIHSHYEEEPNCLVTVHCRQLTAAGWQSLCGKLGTAFGRRSHTIFLDDPAQLAPELQEAIASAVQSLSGQYVILSASREDLYALALSGEFSRRLYVQLCPHTVSLPPLDERREDIPIFAQYLVQQYNKKNSRQIIGLQGASARYLQEFHWALDVEQFEQIILQLLQNSDGHYISEEDLRRTLEGAAAPALDAADISPVSLSGTLKEIELRIIQKIVEEKDMNYTKAAQRLGISRSTLWRKLIKEDEGQR